MWREPHFAFRFALSRAKPSGPPCLDKGGRFHHLLETGGLCIMGGAIAYILNDLRQPRRLGLPGYHQNECHTLNSHPGYGGGYWGGNA